MSTPLRLGVLVSGRGSNMQSIVAAIESGQINAEIAVLISNRPDAPAVAFGRQQGFDVVVIDHKPFRKDRESFEKVIDSTLRDHGVGLVVLAGFMRLLSPWFVRQWANAIINIHPSLLPSFPGMDAHQQALDAGVKITGCTVHFVDEGTDTGPIIAQAAVPVLSNDTHDSLSARILIEEHRLFPTVVGWIAQGMVNVRSGVALVENCHD